MLRAEANAKEVRAFLDEIYNANGKPEKLDELSDGEVMEMARNLEGGVPFATPVFDGANEDEIAGLALRGAPHLSGGRG